MDLVTFRLRGLVYAKSEKMESDTGTLAKICRRLNLFPSARRESRVGDGRETGVSILTAVYWRAWFSIQHPPVHIRVYSIRHNDCLPVEQEKKYSIFSPTQRIEIIVIVILWIYWPPKTCGNLFIYEWIIQRIYPIYIIYTARISCPVFDLISRHLNRAELVFVWFRTTNKGKGVCFLGSKKFGKRWLMWSGATWEPGPGEPNFIIRQSVASNAFTQSRCIRSGLSGFPKRVEI